MGILKVEIDYAEAASVIMASRESARNLLEWCDRLDKAFDLAEVNLEEE